MATLLAATSLLITLMMSASNATASAPSPPVASSDIAATAQEMQRARYFAFVMLVRMVQEKIPRNTTFLMPNDRLLSTASIPESQVLEFLSRHSIAAPLMFNDLIRLPSGTIVPTHHSSERITVTNSGHQKLYFNDVKLTSPDLCHLGDSFRCHGINGVIRPTATRRGKGATCTPMLLRLLHHQRYLQLQTNPWAHLLYHLPTQVLPRFRPRNLQQKALKVQTLQYHRLD